MFYSIILQPLLPYLFISPVAIFAAYLIYRSTVSRLKIKTSEVESLSKLHLATAEALATAIDAKEFAEKLPGRINKVMDALAEGQLTLNVQGIDDKELMRGVQKLANRLTAGLVVAALVIGAALIMRVNARPRLFGYPAIAIVLFTLAAAAAGWLLVSIAISDLPQHRRRRR